MILYYNFFNSFLFFFDFLVKFTFVDNTEFTLYIIAIFSFFFYILALCGLILNLKNLLISLFFIEIVYFALIVFLLFITISFQNFEGFLFALLLILLAASESAVGLGLVILIYTFDKKITFNHLIELA